MKKIITAALLFLSSSVLAHQDTSDGTQHVHKIPAAVEQARVAIETKGAYLYITSNAIPNHTTGQFPNSNNPNAIASQSLSYKVPAQPVLTGKTTQNPQGSFGVAINGIPLDPATAECYGQSRGSKPSPGQSCDWKEEAIVGGQGQLGLDSSNAHVQPNGTYHYHGIPNGLVKTLASTGDLVHVGYAADGFKVYVSRSGQFKPSYKLKSGTRPSGPGGSYTGKYTQDYTYAQGSGNLDECNGYAWENGYAYILTTSFPFIPRCWKGSPDSSFSMKGGGRSAGGQGGMMGSQQGGMGERRGPPQGGMQGGRRPPPRF